MCAIIIGSVSPTDGPPPPPPLPHGLEVVPLNEYSVRVTWQALPASDFPITKYTLKYKSQAQVPLNLGPKGSYKYIERYVYHLTP